MKNLIWIFALILTTGAYNYISAQASPNKYVVFTFEEHFKASPHGIRKYYWIQQVDSMSSNPPHLSALFMSVYSKDNLDDICMNIMTDPFLTKESTDYNLPVKHLAVRDSLQVLVDKNKRRTQTIQKSWTNEQKSTVYIYATPISGRFCIARLHRKESDGEYYNGMIFLPFSGFHFIKEFWATENAKNVSTSDLSRINYSILPISQN